VGYSSGKAFVSVLEKLLVQLDAKQSIVAFLVAQEGHRMQQIFRAMVLHGGSPVSESVKVDLLKPWVLKFRGESMSGFQESGFHRVYRSVAEYSEARSLQGVKHAQKLWACIVPESWEAVLFWLV